MLGKKQPQIGEKEFSGLSWEADIVLNERKSRIIAWRVAAVACGLSIILAIALVLLIPLKAVVPYVVTVDKHSGESFIATSAQDYVSSSELNDKHWVKRFLISHERYNFKLLQHDYDTVRLLAGNKPWQSYAVKFDGDGALDKKYGENTEITPSILSITLNGDGLATVRFELKTKDLRLAAEPRLERYVATMRYTYKPQGARKEAELVDNPLGFTVEAYQTDPEFVSTVSDSGVAR